MPSLCPNCSQTKYNWVRSTPCGKCGAQYGGYYLTSTAKACTDSNCNHGAKKNDPNRDCTACYGTGKKLTRCDRAGCVNGYMRYTCLDSFH
ncbi:uncharacterized protein BDZ99DRAFT_457627, partial [Mytilinidion resinicola]